MSPGIALVRDYSYGMGEPCLFVFDRYRSPADQMDDLLLGRLHDTTTRIVVVGARAVWRDAYRIARMLARYTSARSVDPMLPGRIDIDLGRYHTLSVTYRCHRPLPAEGAR